MYSRVFRIFGWSALILSATAATWFPQAALAVSKVKIAGTAKVNITNIPSVNLNGTPIIRLESGSTVALQPGSAVSLQPGTTLGLEPGAAVSLQPGSTVGTETGKHGLVACRYQGRAGRGDHGQAGPYVHGIGQG
jgi:dUTPase